MAPELRDHPYFRRLRETLEQQGVEFDHEMSLRPLTVARIGWRYDAVHLHWPEFLIRRTYRGSYRGFVAQCRTTCRTIEVIASLALLRVLGVRLVWTVHNLRPHEDQFPVNYRVAYRAFGFLASAIVYHTNCAASVGIRRFGRASRSHVVPQGNYIGYYRAPARGRGDLRGEWGFAEGHRVILAFGQIRANKGLLQLIAAFRELSDPELRLLIVGEPIHAATATAVARAAAADRRILVRLEHVPDDDVSSLFTVADIAAVAYEEIFSSAVLLLALSFGVPVLAPENSSATEIADPPAVEPFAPGSLSDGIVRACRADSSRQRGAAFAAARRYDWSSISADLRRLYDGDRAPIVATSDGQ